MTARKNIDRVDPAPEAHAASSLAAMSEAWRVILTELRLRGPRTIDQLVRASGLSKTAARAHIVRVEAAGLIGRVRTQPRGPGRPPVTFDLTEEGAAAFFTDDAMLLTRLVAWIEDRGQGGLLAAFFEELWAERMRELLAALDVERPDEVDLAARTAAVARTLEERGFMPIVTREDDVGADAVTVRVSECNCPLPAIARASRIPCRLEVDFLSRALGGTPRSVSIAGRRTDRCEFEFVVDSPSPGCGDEPAASDS